MIIADMDQMKLVFVYGAPAVGKLAVARELARLTGYRLFHNHLTVDLVSSVFTFGSEPFVLLREEIWLAVFRAAAENHLSLIFTFNPENTVRERFIQDTLDVVGPSGGKVIFVELTCAEEELERRIENSSRSEFGKLRSVEQYRKLKNAGAFNFPKLPAGLTLDTTNRSPLDTAESIRQYVSGQ
jgi:chloramphenicol 3-O-phosphotransferase